MGEVAWLGGGEKKMALKKKRTGRELDVLEEVLADIKTVSDEIQKSIQYQNITRPSRHQILAIINLLTFSDLPKKLRPHFLHV